ncbi:MAG: thymidine phosphorylase, partial [archaeon]
MKYPFTVQKLDVSTGGKKVVLLSKEDAADLALTPGDRVYVWKNNKSCTAIVDLTSKFIKQGNIGLFSEVVDVLKAKNGEKVYIEHAEKPVSVDYIRKKMDGHSLTKEEINTIISDLMAENLSEVELAGLISAWYIHGLNDEETIALIKSIVASGNTLNFNKRPILDKHCLGGVPGNRTTMLIVPIIASAGLLIPKTSSRSITSPAGTADTMEVLAKVDLNEQELKKVVEATNGCIAWGGAINLAAADDKLIKIRHPLSLDPEGVMLASILAKKKAVGATNVLIDIPMGYG